MTDIDNNNDDFFLPEFCRLQTLFGVLVIAQLLVFVLVMSLPSGVERWTALSLYSLFVQWIAIVSCLLLCLARPVLRMVDLRLAVLLCWLLILLVTLALGELAYRLLDQVVVASRLDFHVRNLVIAAIMAALALRYFYLQFIWRARLEAATQARIQALQARIRPHFLFNSLNTIASMIRGRPQDAEAAVEDLADLFRASLSAGSGFTTLAEEMRLARDYLRLESHRLRERLAVDWQTESLPADAEVPQLILQPLLENAVYYGIEPRVDGGTIQVRGRRNGDTVVIEIRNPPGDPTVDQRRGSGMAQGNVRERLRLAFGKAASFTATADENGYCVLLGFPYRTRRS
ncbi:MAG: histidine kinase [Aquisalimonadaceae bacterium]